MRFFLLFGVCVMKYLLDTHALLWYLNDDENLSEKRIHKGT